MSVVGWAGEHCPECRNAGTNRTPGPDDDVLHSTSCGCGFARDDGPEIVLSDAATHALVRQEVAREETALAQASSHVLGMPAGERARVPALYRYIQMQDCALGTLAELLENDKSPICVLDRALLFWQIACGLAHT